MASMFQPFPKGTKLFIKTVTFYYIATFNKQKQGFWHLSDVTWVETIPDWQEFVSMRPHIPQECKHKPCPNIAINQQAIVDVSVWQ